MAEDHSENTTNSSSSWWGSLINSAKTKSASVYEAVKKDLDEISTVVRTEASNAGTAIQNTLKLDEPESTASNVKKSLSTFFGQVTEALIPSIEDDDSEAILITNNGSITLTGFQKHLAELQNKDETYLNEPDKTLVEKYKRWLEVVEQDQFTENRLAKHLASSHILNDKYVLLVPEKLPHMEFWKRYLFKKALLEDAIANAELAERRAKIEINTTESVSPRKNIIQTTQPKLTLSDNEKPSTLGVTTNVQVDTGIDDDVDDSIDKDTALGEEVLEDNLNLLKNDIKWKTDDFTAANIDLSEEEQARLLEEYELEIQERDKKMNVDKKDDKLIKNDKSNNSNANQKKKSEVNLAKKKQMEQMPQKNKPQQSVNQQKNIKSEPQTGQKVSNTNSKQQPQQVTAKTPAATATTTPSKTKLNNKNEQLSINKNHFTKDDNLSSNSDESWEKEFDLEDE